MSYTITPVVEDTIKTLLELIGDDPYREGLLDTPRRVQKAYDEYFQGYRLDAQEVFKTFYDGAEETRDKEMVVILWHT